MQQQQDTSPCVASETLAQSPVSPPASLAPTLPPATDGFITVLVTPKLTFSLPRRTSWQTTDDIAQEILREGFLARFPVRFDAEKLTFTSTTPALSLAGRDRLVYRINSTAGGDDERILLHILSSLDKAYAAQCEKKFEEVRADMLSSTMSFQVVADEVRTAQEAAARHWEKEVSGLKQQQQMNQKRLFLLEREKEGLVKTVQVSDDVVGRLRRSVDALSTENTMLRERQSDLESQVMALREVVTAHLSGLVAPGGSATATATTTAPPEEAPPGAGASSSSSVGTQVGGGESEADRAARLAVEKWQHAMGEWLRQGAQICNAPPIERYPGATSLASTAARSSASDDEASSGC